MNVQSVCLLHGFWNSVYVQQCSSVQKPWSQDQHQDYFFLSHAFLASQYSRYEFDMARSFDMSYNKKRLIIVMYEDVDPDGMPDDIEMYVKNYTYLERNCVMFMRRLK